MRNASSPSDPSRAGDVAGTASTACSSRARAAGATTRSGASPARRATLPNRCERIPSVRASAAGDGAVLQLHRTRHRIVHRCFCARLAARRAPKRALEKLFAREQRMRIDPGITARPSAHVRRRKQVLPHAGQRDRCGHRLPQLPPDCRTKPTTSRRAISPARCLRRGQ